MALLRSYKDRVIRYSSYQQKDRWTASAVVLTVQASSMDGEPIFLKEAFTQAEAETAVINAAKARIDKHGF